MRNIKHHAIIITAHDLKLLQQVKVTLGEMIKQNIEASNGIRLLGEITESLINNFYSLIVFPDGSKEGHETSDDGDILRKKITDYLEQHNKTHKENLLNFIEVYFGSDDGTGGVLKHG